MPRHGVQARRETEPAGLSFSSIKSIVYHECAKNFLIRKYGLAVSLTVMDYVFDPAKEARNVAERGLSLALAPYVFEGLVHVVDDDRKDYGERRQVAYGLIRGRLFVYVFTDRAESRRVISLRKANSREVEAYAQKDHA